VYGIVYGFVASDGHSL